MNRAVKRENSDEAEIQELAAQMIAANKAKMQTTKASNTTGSFANNFGVFNLAIKTVKGKTDTVATADPNEKSLGDEESQKGRFGWVTIANTHVPYLIRNAEQYCSVRILELELLNKYLNFLHQDIYNCTCIRSYFITDAECRLLNEINVKHCDSQFGREQFTGRDLIVRLSDTREFYDFLDSCYNKLIHGVNNSCNRCGFIRINNESVVPYTLYNTRKYVPLFYFEGETENLKLRATRLEGWDLSYLKFCCKVQGIRNELFAHDSCSVISLNDITSYFPPGTLFEDYWPSKVVDSQLLIKGKNATHVAQWIRQPTGPPVPHAQPSPKPATQAKPVANNHMGAAVAPYPSYSGRPAAQSRYCTPTTMRTYPAYSPLQPDKRPGHIYYLPQTSQAQPPPPPLIRAPTYRNTPATQNFMMLESTINSTGYRQAGVHKFVPPLIPAPHLHQYESPANHYRTAVDIVELSGNNRLPTHTVNSNNILPVHQSIINQQPAHQQPPRSPSARPLENCSNIQQNGRMQLSDLPRKLIPIPDIPSTTINHIPYKMQKVTIDCKVVPCINMKPFLHTDLLITTIDVVDLLFHNIPLSSCHQVMQVLGMEFYKGNSAQMRLLKESGRIKNICDIVPLVQVRLVIEFMPQLKYMLGGCTSTMASKRQQRTS